MPTGYKVNGTDLDALFMPRGTSTPRPSTGFRVGTQDLADRYFASTSTTDRIAMPTGFRVGATDLRDLFRSIAFAGLVITTHPASGSYVEMSSMTLTVAAIASGGALSYQWQRDVGAGYVNVGTNSSSYTIGSLALSDAGNYRCVVSDANGSATSNAAAIAVTVAPPSITSHPSAFTGNTGDTGRYLECHASGGGTLYFQWFKDGVAQHSPRTGNLFGTGDRYSFAPTLEFTNEGTWHCRVSNEGGYADTITAAVQVKPIPPQITTPPSNVSVGDGATGLYLEVQATSLDTLRFQWFKDGQPASSLRYGNVNPTTDRLYLASPIHPVDAGTYTVDVYDMHGQSTSASVTVSVAAPYPVAGAIEYWNGSAWVTGTANWHAGDGPHAIRATGSVGGGAGYTLLFEWYEGGNFSQNTPRTGNLSATQDQLVWNPITRDDSGTYHCRISIQGHPEWGYVDTGTLNVNATYNPPTITGIYYWDGSQWVSGSSVTWPAGQGPYGFKCTATGEGTLRFGWYQSGSLRGDVHTGNLDANTDQIVFNPVAVTDLGSWTCMVYNEDHYVTSSAITLSVQQ